MQDQTNMIEVLEPGFEAIKEAQEYSCACNINLSPLFLGIVAVFMFKKIAFKLF